MSPLRLLQEPKKKVSFVKPKRFGGAGGGWEPETKIEKGLRLAQPYMPTPTKLFEAGRRYPRALFGGLEALQKAEPIIPAIKKGFVPEIFAPKEKVRTPTQIAWDMADGMYATLGMKDQEPVKWRAFKKLPILNRWATVQREALKLAPFTTAGVAGEIFTDPAILLTFKGINKLLTNPQVAKFMGKEVKAPQWVDKTIRGAIKGFHKPLETISAGVKENRINALTNETYKKLSPYRTQIEKATKYKFRDEADFKGFIKSEFIKKGVYEAPLTKIQARIQKVKGLKPKPKVEPTPEPPVVKPKVSLIKKSIEPLRLLRPEIKPITPEVPVAKPAEVPLIEQAKKYKTAEEFVEAQKINPAMGNFETGMSKLNELKSLEKEIDRLTLLWKKAQGMERKNLGQEIGVLRDKIRSIKLSYKEMDELGDFLFDESSGVNRAEQNRVGNLIESAGNYGLTETKAQLTDIWKQAQVKPAEVPLKIEKKVEGIPQYKHNKIIDLIEVGWTPEQIAMDSGEDVNVIRAFLSKRGYIKPAEVLKQLPLLTGKKRIGKVTALPRGETFELIGLPKKVGLSARQRIAEEQRGIQIARLRAEGKIPTIEQMRKAHTIAREKALITPEGKTTPGYRALAKGMTGKSSMKEMTQQEAESFIQSLKGISEPRYIKGKLVPPSIPRTTALVKPEFFQQRFRKPTPAKFVTSQTRYAELLGIKKLVAPMEIGKQVLDLEYAKGAHQIDTAVKELKKANIDPKQMAIMLNTFEEAPPDISEQGKKVFNYFRDLTKDVITRENEIRATLKLPPIEYRQAYFRHIADKMSQEIIDGKYPLPEGLKYWSEQTVGKKVYNPMEMQRKLSDDLLEKFSSDLPYVMKSMLWTGLKEVHLSIPKNILHKELGILSKDKAVYKNLTPQEQKLYDAQMTMPAATKKWLLDYVNIVLSGRQTALDESVNLWITDTPIKSVLNSILKPFGEHIGQKPVTDMLSSVSKLPIYGAMGGVNPRQLIRNKFQTLQNMALYGVKNTIKGYTPTSSYPTLQELKTDSLFKKSYSGFEDLPIGMMGKLEKAGLAPYQWSAVSNVSQAMNSSYHWTTDNIQSPKKSHLGWADPKRTYTEPKNFFYPSEKAKLLKEMEYGAHTTQYQYIGLGMPEVFRYKALAPLTRLQSWWMNHWFVFHREAATRAFTGHAGYDPKLKITLGDRVNYLKYLIIGGLILTNLGYYRSYLLGTAPTGLPPTGQLMMGLYEYFTNTGDSSWEKRKQAQAENRIKEAAKIHIPGYLSIKDFRAFMSGEKHWTEYLFYKKAKKLKLDLPLLKEEKDKLSLIKTKKSKLLLLQ